MPRVLLRYCNYSVCCRAEIESTVMCGVTHLQRQLVELLLENMANIHLQNNGKMTPLHTAVLTNHIEVVKV